MEPHLTRMGPPVTGQPYSGALEAEHIQTLSHGTLIDQKREISRQHRDSQGRTRSEQMLAPMLQPGAGNEAQPRLIQIYDPVEGCRYTLEPRKHIAHRVAVQMLPENPTRRTPTSANSTNAGLMPLQPGALGGSAKDLHRNLKREPLGTEMIDGVEAEGWRTTITTPVGTMGNDKPITHVCETWNAVELKTLLLSKCTDPRSGRLTIRLKNLDRSEPDASLFLVPADYTIVDDKDQFTMNLSEP